MLTLMSSIGDVTSAAASGEVAANPREYDGAIPAADSDGVSAAAHEKPTSESVSAGASVIGVLGNHSSWYSKSSSPM